MGLNQKFRDARYAVFYGLLLNKSYPLQSLGNAANGCSWSFCPTGLDQESVVYSGGVGNDITFEHALVKQFGCKVVLLDPSPTGLATMQRPEHQMPEFQFIPAGLAGQNGVLNLAPPQNAEEGSWYSQPAEASKIQVPCHDLTTVMKRNGHTRIDLLKLDIEGSEYGVIDDILSRRIPIRQICVEYHHPYFPGISLTDTVRSVLRLRMRGYKLLCQEGTNHTFFWPGRWP
jgi:FkbM family methyltransferase